MSILIFNKYFKISLKEYFILLRPTDLLFDIVFQLYLEMYVLLCYIWL